METGVAEPYDAAYVSPAFKVGRGSAQRRIQGNMNITFVAYLSGCSHLLTSSLLLQVVPGAIEELLTELERMAVRVDEFQVKFQVEKAEKAEKKKGKSSCC